MSKKLGFLGLVLFLVSTSHRAWSYSFSPMVAELLPSGPLAAQNFSITNSEKNDVPIEIKVKSRSIDENGKELRSETKEINFFPRQFVLKAGESRQVRVTYVGPEKIDMEKSFRLIAEQLPVDLKKAKTGKKTDVQLNFLLSFVASIYVTPEGAQPKLSVVKSKMDADSVELNVENQGNAHIIMKDIKKIVLKRQNQSLELSGDDLEEIKSENILANSKRVLKFKLPKDKRLPVISGDLVVDLVL